MCKSGPEAKGKHYGIPRYNTLLSTTIHWLGAKLLSRSGEQLYVVDTYSDKDKKPLLEILADPARPFHQALKRFERIDVFANGINDHTVPYPTAAIQYLDHFADWEQEGLVVDTDTAGFIQDYHKGKRRRRRWKLSIGHLPPVLRYRFPFNYLILLLFPLIFPLILVVLITRLLLDSRRSSRRVRELDSVEASAKGSSTGALRDAISKAESNLESQLLDLTDPPNSQQNPSTLRLTRSQLRIVSWLNELPLHRHTTWWPDVPNAHAVIVVRDPKQFPLHERGRAGLQRWAKIVAAS